MRQVRARRCMGVAPWMGCLLAASLGAFMTGCASDRSTDALVAQLLAEDAKTDHVSPARSEQQQADSPAPKADSIPDPPSRNPAPVAARTGSPENGTVTIQPKPWFRSRSTKIPA